MDQFQGNNDSLPIYDDPIFLLERAGQPLTDSEIYYDIEIDGISIDLDKDNLKLELSDRQGNLYKYDMSVLDDNIDNISGSVEYMSYIEGSGSRMWENQELLKGGVGNDVFKTKNRQYSEDNHTKETSYIASYGSDIYSGSQELDYISYLEIERDELTGLYLSDEPSNLPIISNNLPPLVVGEYQEDDLLIYKRYSNEVIDKDIEVDIARDIEILSLTSGDDTYILTSDKSPAINFGDGLDKVYLYTNNIEEHTAKFSNLEKIYWNPRGVEVSLPGETEIDELYEFDVLNVSEDETEQFYLASYLESNDEYQGYEWELHSFEDNEREVKNYSNWINLSTRRGEPDVLGKDKVVVYTETIIDEKDPSKVILEIHAKDLRNDGNGLIGLDIDVEWDSTIYQLTQDQLDRQKVFDEINLPLFQNKGTLGFENDDPNVSSLKNLVAAALPRSGTGNVLGNKSDSENNTLFGKLEFKKLNDKSQANINIKLNSYPASNGKEVSAEDILYLREEDREKIWVVNINPSQNEVGTHLFKLQAKSDPEIQKYIAVAVNNTNDAPIVTDESELDESDLIVQAKEGIYFRKDIRKLFNDQDYDFLIYKIQNGPGWLNINNQEKTIEGIPPSDAQGITEIQLIATDLQGLTVERKIVLEIENSNQAPFVGTKIDIPEISEGQELTYRLPKNAFVDKDINEANDIIEYSLHSLTSNDHSIDWINIDKSTGLLTGKPEQKDVGKKELIIRATDLNGVFAEQKIVISVKNVNNSPFQTAELTRFIEQQNSNSLGIGEDSDSSIYIDKEQIIDISKWFDDPDFGYDLEEYLDFKLFLELDSGESLKLNDEDYTAENSWITYDTSTKKLIVSPTDNEIGRHYIRIDCTDKEGTQASSTIPIQVMWRNRGPEILTDNLIEFISNQTGTNIENISFDNNKLKLMVSENADINFRLPRNLFKDEDLNVEHMDEISINMNQIEEAENPIFYLNTRDLSIRGNTLGCGLKSVLGQEQWNYVLVASDRHGKEARLDLEIDLQRKAYAPSIILDNDKSVWNEDEKIDIGDIVKLDFIDRKDHTITFKLQHKNKLNQEIVVRSKEDKILTGFDNGEYKQWIFSGNIEEVRSIISGISIKNKEGSSISEKFSLEFLTYSQLGEEGLKSENVSASIDIQLEPIPTIPIWIDGYVDSIKDPWAFSGLGEYIQAKVDDENEIISYRVNSDESEEHLHITDKDGNSIGIKDSNGWLIGESEWQNAVVRSISANERQIQLNIQAQSQEPSNLRTALGTQKTFNWIATPYLIDKPIGFIDTPKSSQPSGQSTHIQLDLELANAVNAVVVEFKLPKGSSMVAGDRQILIDRQNSEVDTFKLSINGVMPSSKNMVIPIEIKSPDIYNGKMSGSYQIISSARDYINNLDISEIESDIKSGIAKTGDVQIFEWDIYQVAMQPEIASLEQDDEQQANYDSETQKLEIPYRRGASIEGIRNPNEELMVVVSNIPFGFTLAELKDGEYQSVGATDAFGTTTLFSIKGGPEATHQLDNYQKLNNSNLYLVKEDPRVVSTLDNHHIFIEVTASVDQGDGNISRSTPSTLNIKLSDSLNQDYRYIGKGDLYIDPLIIDLSGEGNLTLTSLFENNEHTFRMIPDKDKMKSGWIFNTETKQSTAFLALNNKENDQHSDKITISSITELFSEYFQSTDGLRTYNSGIDALSSIDSNKDSKINDQDKYWDDLILWMDDGDRKSEENEIHSLSSFVNEIIVNEVTNIEHEYEWSKGNKILRRIQGSTNEGLISIYDVGLKTSASKDNSLQLNISSPINVDEGSFDGKLHLSSVGSEEWSSDGRDALTLVRLSGLPDEIVPSVGVQDLRGDWLFTWADIATNNGVIQLIPDDDWSGSVNGQVMISQIQRNGQMLASPLETFLINIEAVADPPLIRTKKATVYEDSKIKLTDIIKNVASQDKDGSESIHLELENPIPGLAILDLESVDVSNYYRIEDKYQISIEDIDNLYILPPTDFSGVIDLHWKLVSTEVSNNSQAVYEEHSQLVVIGSADSPLQLKALQNLPTLTQGGKVYLSDILVLESENNLLVDKDGSEKLLVNIIASKKLILSKNGDNNWLPVEVTDINQDLRKFTIDYNDIGDIYVKDNGLEADNEDVGLTLTLQSQEIRNADNAISTQPALEIKIPFNRDAKPVNIDLLKPDTLLEDSIGWRLSDLIIIRPDNVNDAVSILFQKFPSNIYLISPDHEIKDVDVSIPVDLDQLGEWIIVPKKGFSGDISIEFKVISSPPGMGSSASSLIHKIDLSISPVADTPILKIGQENQNGAFSSTGWLDIGSMDITVESNDDDGSEEMFLILGCIDKDGNKIDLTQNTELNTTLAETNQGRYIVPKELIKTLKLYLGLIEEEVTLTFSAMSKDGESTAEGNTVNSTIKPNILLKAPLIEVSNVLRGNEDELLPLIKSNNGVIDVAFRDEVVNQRLELEISNLPIGSKLLRRIVDVDGNVTYSDPLNRLEDGSFTSKLRLGYLEWSNIYLQSPEDISGTFSMNAQAFAVSKEKEQGSGIETIQILIDPVNDAPQILNSTDLLSIMEGESGEWDLKNRFFDSDHSVSDLQIDVQLLETNQTLSELPQWLNLNDKGILTGTPSNNSVGAYNLLISATDPLGKMASFRANLYVGNTNNPPIINHTYDAIDLWQKEYSNDEIIYSKSINLYETLSFVLLNDRSPGSDPNGLFSDPDSLHESEEIYFKISRDLNMWDKQIEGLAEITGNKLIINPSTKSLIGNQTLYIQASDNHGGTIIQQLNLEILNVNEAPSVIRKNATSLGDQRWIESLTLLQGEANWSFNPGTIFNDNDPGDRLTISQPYYIPDWISIDPTGQLIGIPQNKDVGEVDLTWRATDLEGEDAYYTLKLVVQNINDKPLFNEEFSTVNGKQGEYSIIDLSQVFLDDDIIHGDVLEYTVKLLDQERNEVEDFDWIKLNYSTQEVPNLENKIFIQPVIYSIDNNSSIASALTQDDLKILPQNTRLRVSIEVSDFRIIDKKGLVGTDLDIAWNQNLEIVEDSIHISDELPLFNQINLSSLGMRINAGSAPDALGIGGTVGDEKNESILTFDMILRDPDSATFITVTPGLGNNRDGLLDRYAKRLDDDESIIQSLSTKSGAMLDILSPSNEFVGSYYLQIEATDQYEATSTAEIELTIENINDKPFINSAGISLLKNSMMLLDSNEEALPERVKINLPPINLFNDPDLELNSSVNETLDVRIINYDHNFLDAISVLDHDEAGNVSLSINSPSGISDYISQKFKILATDTSGESIETDWFTAMFKPVAEITNITSGHDQRNLEQTEYGFKTKKNLSFDIAQTFELNALQLNDPLGDQLIFNVSVPYKEVSLSIPNLDVVNFIDQQTDGDNTLFRVDIHKLSLVDGRSFGDLSGLTLKIPDNQFNIIRNPDSSQTNLAVPIDIWTETSVLGASKNQFNVVNSQRSRLWLDIENSRPYINDIPVLSLTSSDEAILGNRTLINFSDFIVDDDHNEILDINIEIPRKLQDLLLFDALSNELRLSPSINSITDLPAGLHKIGIRIKDSSGLSGHKSGFANGIFQLLISNGGSIEGTALGLNLLSNINQSDLNVILTKTDEDLNNDEFQLIAVLNKIGILPNTNKGSSYDDLSIANATEFISKLQSGSAAVIQSTEVNSQQVLILESTNHNKLLMDANVGLPHSSILEDSTRLLSVSPETILSAPLGEVDFVVDTFGDDSAIVNLHIPADINIDSLIKTNADGIPSVFNSNFISYNNESLDLDEWINQLTYGVYDYSSLDPTNSQQPVISLSSSTDSLTSILSSIGYASDNVSNLDGSAYLIDTNLDGQADMISMLLLDEGWFDTRKGFIGLIGDPLTPISIDIESTFQNTNIVLNDTPNLIGLQESTSALQSQNTLTLSGPDINTKPNVPDANIVAANIMSNAIKAGDTNYNLNAFEAKQLTNTFKSDYDYSPGSNLQADINLVISNNQSGDLPTFESQEFSPLQYTENQRTSSIRNNDLSSPIRNLLQKPFDSLVELSNSFSIPGILAALFIPTAGERLATRSLKSFQLPEDLKLKRRNRFSNGKWLIPIRSREFKQIEYNGYCFSAYNVDIDSDIFDTTDSSLLPPFTSDGNSYLFQYLSLSNKPGDLIQSIQKLSDRLRNSSDYDLNWVGWLDCHFDHLEKLSRWNFPSIKQIKYLRFRGYIEKLNANDPDLADVFMFAQLDDCCDQLGFNRLKRYSSHDILNH